MSRGFSGHATVDKLAAMTVGFDRAFAIAAVVCAVAALTALALPRRGGGPAAA
jgi:hypothetical protein